jgi:hypothetical protein
MSVVAVVLFVVFALGQGEDASWLACPSVNMDEAFGEKLERNNERAYQCGEGSRQAAW